MPPNFQQTQTAFTHWLRHPTQAALPADVLPERMHTYRELLLNNVTHFVDSAYPVTKALLPDTLWRRLVIDFFEQYHCKSPYFYDISLHFREFISVHSEPELTKTPWLIELLHFEWSEMAADLAEVPNPSTEPDVQLADESLWHAPDTPLQLAMPTWPLAYQWPVASWTVATPLEELQMSPQTVLLWRNADDHVCTLIVQPIAAWLIERLQNEPYTLNDLASQLHTFSPDLSHEDALAVIRRTFLQLQRSGLAFLS